MSYGDTYVERVTATVDDEFQERILFRAESVGQRYAYWATMAVVALLVWVLPGAFVVCSLLPVVPLLAGALAATRWMKRYAPRPRPLRLSAPECAGLVVLVLVWCAGLAFHVGNGAMATGALCGAVVGGPAAWLLMRWQRASDQTRLNADLED